MEPIDNANDLHGLGGLGPLVALLGHEAPAVAAAAAHALGTAASNNPAFQRQLLSQQPEAVATLLRVRGSPGRLEARS